MIILDTKTQYLRLVDTLQRGLRVRIEPGILSCQLSTLYTAAGTSLPTNNMCCVGEVVMKLLETSRNQELQSICDKVKL